MFQVPNAELFYLTQKNTLKKKTVHDELKGKKVVVYFVCGAYTPTCSTKHVPEFEEAYDEIKSHGIDEVYCCSMNDPWVMKSWWKSMGIKKQQYLCDGNGAWLLRFEQFASQGQKVVQFFNTGMGRRAWRHALVIHDNMVIHEVMEGPESGEKNNSADDPYEFTSAASILEYLRKRETTRARLDEFNKKSDSLSDPTDVNI
ncbi:MAG: hypothetical protein CML44_06045 [Rhodobacteraceae bacterium]|nr:hypothetical protein [Paracoccaceae bacterium]|tara:strand:+ start:788 stop:1390 length:603 start_codon:yes stop_codon:yes gene_type:complete